MKVSSAAAAVSALRVSHGKSSNWWRTKQRLLAWRLPDQPQTDQRPIIGDFHPKAPRGSIVDVRA